MKLNIDPDVCRWSDGHNLVVQVLQDFAECYLPEGINNDLSWYREGIADAVWGVRYLVGAWSDIRVVEEKVREAFDKEVGREVAAIEERRMSDADYCAGAIRVYVDVINCLSRER